ncbi:MAG: hypothetical protein WC621_05690 [Patescibacteria group bacterium]
MFNWFTHRNTKTRPLVKKTQVSRALGVTCVVAVIALALGYVVTVNGVATTGYQIRKLQRQLTELHNDNKKMEVVSATLQSLKAIEGSLDKSQFVAVDRLEYLAATPIEVGVAVK